MMAKKSLLISAFAVTMFFLTLLAWPLPSVSAASGVKTAGACGKNSTFLLMPTWYKHLDFDDNCSIVFSHQIVDKDGNIDKNFDYGTIWKIALAVVEMLLMLAGMVATAFVMIGAFKFTTTQGSPDKLAKARMTVANAIVGALIAILASRVVGYMAGKFSAGSTSYGLVNASADKGTITTIFNIALTALGAISVLALTISGIQFIVSSNNPDKIAKARNAIYYAITGLAVAIFGATLINFVVGRLS
jgi:hypothetical protein